MSRTGRPLRFLALTVGGWTAARVVLLWPAMLILPAARPALSAKAVAGSGTGATSPAIPFAPERWLADPVDRSDVPSWPAIARVGPARDRSASPVGSREADQPHESDSPGQAATVGPLVTPDGPVPQSRAAIPPARTASRLSGSAWAIVRGGSGGTLLGGQLGASQAGGRLTYALGEARRLALSARVASPLSGRGKEAAFGVDWQPTRLPLHLLAEQRVSLDGARGGPSLMLVGGIAPLSVLAGFRLEAYAQAGAIKRDGVEAFGDGTARITRPLATIGAVRLDLGGGAWGAAQRGVRRLDLGPTIGAVVPVAGKNLRLTLDWRERLAGNARPDSGPALSLGTDF